MLEKKEFFCLSDGWLLSTLLIIRKGKLQLKDILTIGNILNHAFFTLEEVNNGLSRLESENYIELKDGKFNFKKRAGLKNGGKTLCEHYTRKDVHHIRQMIVKNYFNRIKFN